ncbi:hypothetical protein N9383_05750 [Granulosicoccus sp.]|nr:hypothetical protein [Granulosicoccus sp.]
MEPRRFEDLARQLIYDFRSWSALEATGRQGADDGFDARGWEVVRSITSHEGSNEYGENSADEITGIDRIWLIQCKREKSIGPKKLISYLEDISAEERKSLHGVMLVASCDFSKKSRDGFREWCAENNISEFYIWGRGELEDLLFHPSNDHLLFAYFGISLQIRKRSVKTRINSVLSIKRMLDRNVATVRGAVRKDVLIRDPDAFEYPYSQKIANFIQSPKWKVYECIGHYHNGLLITVRSFFAYFNPENEEWDADETYNLHQQKNKHWLPTTDRDREWEIRDWLSHKPQELQGTLQIIGLIPYEEIVAIDELGDHDSRFPHIFVRFYEKCGPFYDGHRRNIITVNPFRKIHSLHDEKRIKYFPDSYS